MKPPIFRPLAEADLRRVVRESIELFGLMQAQAYFDKLSAATTALAAGLRTGRTFDRENPERLRLNVGAHVVVYRVRSDGRILVLRILHSRMDLSSHL